MKKTINLILLLTATFVSMNVHSMDPNKLQEEIDLLKQQKEYYTSKTDYNRNQNTREDHKISTQKAATDAAIQTGFQIAGKNVEKLIDTGVDYITGAGKEKQTKEEELHKLTQAAKKSEKQLNEGRFINEQIDATVKAFNTGAINKQERDKRLKGYMAELDIINGHTYSEEPATTTTPQETSDTKATPTPGMIKQAAMFAATAPFLAADKIADTLKINAALARLAQSDTFKGGLLEAHQKNIGQAAALAIIASTLGAIYKAYSWYNNEDRIIAQETVIELENQQKEIALQFSQEIQKATLSAEEKTKLIKAYENYMEELQDEINEQKAIAGYKTIAGYQFIPAKLAMIALAAAGGITGLTMLAKFYLNKPIDAPTNEPTEQQNLTDSTPTEPQKPDQSEGQTIPTPETPSDTTANTQNSTEPTTQTEESGLTTMGTLGFGALGTVVVGAGYFLTGGFSGMPF